MFPNSGLDQDSKLRKAIRSTGLKVARVSSPVKTSRGVQYVDVFDGDSGSEYKDVPILRQSADFIALPHGSSGADAGDILAFGVAVLLGFLEGSRAPVVLGVINSGAGGELKQVRAAGTRTGVKKLDNALPLPYEGDRMLSNEENVSRIILRAADGDISVFVWDMDLEAYNKAKTPAEKEAIIQESLSRDPNFDLFLYGAAASFRIIRNSTNQEAEILNDNERILNARYWGVYKNLVEYPYIASLAHRIRTLEDLMGSMLTVMEALATLAATGDPTKLPDLAPSLADFIEAAAGPKNPEAVREKITFGVNTKQTTPDVEGVRDQGADQFLPLVVYEWIANQIGITTQTIESSDDIDRPMGFGGSAQLGELFPPEQFATFSPLTNVVAAALTGKVPPDKLNLILTQVAATNPAFSDAAPGGNPGVQWESLMSSLVKLGIHYEGKASGTVHAGLTES